MREGWCMLGSSGVILMGVNGMESWRVGDLNEVSLV